jgi:predicted membrane protein (TIGR00267 family)
MRRRAKPSVLARLRAMPATVRQYHEIAALGSIARRYFAMNAFDGVLTSVGILAGAFLGGVEKAHTVVSVVVAASVSMGVSGFYGSYLVERAERGRALRELEESTLSRLDRTDIGAAVRYASAVIALIDGASPAAASLLMIVPFFFARSIGVHAAYYVGWGVAFVELFLLGAFLGRISRERIVVSGLKLVLAGGISLGLSLLLHAGGL